MIKLRQFMLELPEKHLKAVVIKMPQQSITNSLKTNKNR